MAEIVSQSSYYFLLFDLSKKSEKTFLSNFSFCPKSFLVTFLLKLSSNFFDGLQLQDPEVEGDEVFNSGTRVIT